MSASNLRNLTFIGHSDAGKTCLVEALAHHYGATTRLGSINEGNTVCDFSDAEKEKKHSLGGAVVHLDKQSLNLIDTPGYPDFLADAVTSLGAAGCAVVTLAANNEGFPFHGVRMWEMAGELGLARAVALTKVDHENLDLDAIIENLHERLGFQVVPFTLPDQVGPGFSSVKAVASDENPFRSQLVDAIVEADDELMERYLEEGDVSDEDLARVLPQAMAKGTLAPLFFLDPLRGIGIPELADFIVDDERDWLGIRKRRNGDGFH